MKSSIAVSKPAVLRSWLFALVAAMGFLAGRAHGQPVDLPLPDVGHSEYFPFLKNDVVMIVGDSIGGPRLIDPIVGKAFPERNVMFLHAGIGTTTIKEAAGRMERDLIRGDLGDADVSWYIVMFGANDLGIPALATGGGYEAYYRQLITTLKRRTHAHIIPVWATPVRGGSPTAVAFGQTIKKLAGEYNLKVVDLYNPTLDFIKEHGQAAFSADGIHPIVTGHLFMAETLLRQMEIDGVHEQVTVDLKTAQIRSSQGCAVAKKAGDPAVNLCNLYDFAHTVALEVQGQSADVWQNGKKLEPKDGRVLVTLPAGLNWVMDDLKQVQAESVGSTDIAARAARIMEDIRQSRTVTLLVLPGGQEPPKSAPQTPADPAANAVAESLSLGANVLGSKEAQNDNLRAPTEAFVQQFCDLRLNYPVATPKDIIRMGGPGQWPWNYALRSLYGLTRVGNAALKPKEKFQVIFSNFDCPSVSGKITVELPPQGWQVKALTPTAFTDLKRGRRFTCEFELTGEETATYQGDMTFTASYDMQGLKLQKQVVHKLFAPWLGIGSFCAKAENEKDSFTVKIGTVYPPEEKIDLKAVYQRYDGKQLVWKPFRSFYGYPGIQREGEVYWTYNITGSKELIFTAWPPEVPNPVPGVAPIYIADWIYSPEDREVTLLPVFYSRAGKMWINGSLVVDVNNTNMEEYLPWLVGMNWAALSCYQQDKPKLVDAKLKKGWNTVLFKLLQGTKYTDSFGLHILDKAGKPIPDLLGSCVPPQ